MGSGAEAKTKNGGRRWLSIAQRAKALLSPSQVDQICQAKLTKAHVFESEQDMFEGVGFSYLAKAMFDEAGISSEEVIK